MEQEDTSEIADQVSEFRKEALNSTDNIAEISKALKEALDNQSAAIGNAENEIAAGAQSEESQAAAITAISDSLSNLLGVQQEILNSLRGLNENISSVTQQQGDDLGGGAGGNSGGGGGSNLASLLGMGTVAAGAAAVTAVSYGGGGGGNSPNISADSGYYSALFGQESGGNYNIFYGGNEYGDLSTMPISKVLELQQQNLEETGASAVGVGQFTKDTLAGLLETEEVRAAGITADTNFTPEVQNQLLEIFTQRNADALESENVPVNDATLAGAHFLGAGGFSDFYGQDRNAPVSSVLSEEVINLNQGLLKGKTVGQVLDYFNNRYGTGQTWREGVVLEETAQPITPLTLNWGGELPESITEGSNEITLTDPVSGEEFSVNFEVEEVDGNFVTTGPVTLAEDTDLEGLSGAAGDPVEVSAEMAADLADQVGASIEPTDLETPATPEEIGAGNQMAMTPEAAPTAVDLEEDTVTADASTAERTTESSAQQTQTASADYSESASTPISFTGGNWHKQVNDYYSVA